MLCNTMPGKCQYPLMFSSKDYKRTEMSWRIVYIYLCEAADSNTDTCMHAILIGIQIRGVSSRGKTIRFVDIHSHNSW